MKKIILLLLSLSLMVTGCKKKSNDNSDSDDSPDLTGLIKSVSIDGRQIMEFSYNSNGKLKTKTMHSGGTVEVNYDYTGNLITSETAKQNGTVIRQYTYEYNNSNNLTRVYIVGSTGYWEMNYDTNGKISEAIQYDDTGNEFKKKEYTYNGDNLVEATEFWRFGSNWVLHERSEYDNLKNPFFDLHLPYSEKSGEFASFISPHNTTREKVYGENNILTSDYQYQITYNDDHYPIRVVVINSQEAYDITYY